MLVFFSVLVIAVYPILATECNGQATCVSLTDCNHYVDFLGTMQKPLKASVVHFLRSQHCGFRNGYPRVCCAPMPKGLKIFDDAKVGPSFDVVVSTAPPNAMPVPHFQRKRKKHKKFYSKSEDLLDFDLFRRRRSPNGVNVEIR
ncbi:PREDICTED: uncharacterized protein LOC108560569 [Nicrophorus vespilloides]|uniref:Uncharacterized protein LOC108560569 n=1 Tax=Nicrophorus vespilloides TaxID=110193 RepID=A0ABM1MGH0_NICVS|nr:PREDICTED: uncharacterized protein LOC108560569 [Nicrophorus vespilloides]